MATYDPTLWSLEMKQPVHVAITRKVKPGCESIFENAIQRFFKESEITNGSLGVQLIKPLPGNNSNTFGILRSFASDKDREDFYQSNQFREWDQIIQPLVEPGYTRREIELHGLEAFFSNPSIIRHPPRWKMAVVTWMGVWPTVLLVSLLISPHLSSIPLWLAVGIDTLVVVLALTWAVMPLLTGIMRPWLVKPTHDNRTERNEL
jgi:antibiotic biosynthesis monooxygenase (ABM) superfamily enzyme